MPKHFLVFFACMLLSAFVCAQQFQHVSAANNVESGWTYLDDPRLNNNPKAIIHIELMSGPSKGKNLGVWYYAARSKWAIFHQDRSPMQPGNVFTVNPTALFVHKAAKNNIDNYITILDHPQLNNNPNAAFVVTPNWNPDAQGGTYDDHAISIAYKGNRWMIAHNDKTPMPDGAAFNISIGKGKEVVNVPQNNAPVTQVFVDPGVLVTAADANLNFENGLTRWNPTGTAFNNQPVEGTTIPSERVLTRMAYANGGVGGDYWKGLPYEIGVKNNKWIGTYEKGNGDAPTGTLTSPALRTSNRYLHFLLGGGKDINRVYVELQIKKSDYEAAWGAGKKGFFGDTEDGFTRVNRVTPLINSEELFRYWFDLDAELNHQFTNKTVRLCIVDNSSLGWGHINVDDIGQADDLSNFISLMRDGFRLYADKNKPVWGYFDSHAHPGADEAFGKNYYVGSSVTPLSTTWSNDVCTRSHTWGRTLDGFTNIFDPHKFFDGGWPDMLGFPKFNGKMHQKYQVDLIKRAWQGGLKIFCALGINNMYIATRALGHDNNGEALDDESVLLRQVAVMKEMARVNSDWMEIALTPQDARRIILEGKLCVILGVESDVFGNFKSPDCTWGDRREDRPLVTITEADANEKLERKLDEYYALGLRQILPLHYLSQPFGGTAVFNGNTFLPQITFYDHVRVKTGIPDRIGFSLYEDFPTMASFTGNFMAYPAYVARVWKQDEGTETSMVNADGLTPVGNILFKKLMKKGFIIDQEHASYQSKRDIIRLASVNNYPIMASHCGPEGLSFIWTGAPVRFNGSHEDKIRNFQTSTIRYVSHEMELNDETYTGIRNTQGTVGVFASLNHKQKYTGRWGNFPNDCPGSTKTMAQMYCYSLDKMNGKGVGIGTDLPMIDALSPRFGPYAAWALTGEEHASLKKDLRTENRMAQRNGVKYDVPSRTYYHELFQGGDIDGFEEDAWKAFAAWEAGVNAIANESLVALSGAPGHAGRIRNMVKGLNAASQDQLMRPCITCGDAPWEQAATFCLKNNITPQSLTIFDAGGIRDVANMYNKILPFWTLWVAKSGTNEPLRRYITGTRHWDFNLDGLAHYGLMPDMLQDLKNIGFTQLQLKPLFSSAEDYIRMWERAEALKSSVRE